MAQGLGFMGFSIYIIGLEHTIYFGLLAGCVLLWVRLWHGPLSKALRDRVQLKPIASVLLLCCLVFGYLRGEHLREQPASMTIYLTSEAKAAVTVVMSFNQGVLVFQTPNAEPRLYPWDRIAWIGPASSESVIKQRLRDGRDAVRRSIDGAAATVRSWMGWPAVADPPVAPTPAGAPKAKEIGPPGGHPKPR